MARLRLKKFVDSAYYTTCCRCGKYNKYGAAIVLIKYFCIMVLFSLLGYIVFTNVDTAKKSNNLGIVKKNLGAIKKGIEVSHKNLNKLQNSVDRYTEDAAQKDFKKKVSGKGSGAMSQAVERKPPAKGQIKSVGSGASSKIAKDGSSQTAEYGIKELTEYAEKYQKLERSSASICAGSCCLTPKVSCHYGN